MAFHDDVALQDLGGGSFSTEIIDNYWIVAGPNGGYLGALLANAGDLHVAKTSHQLRSLTIHYLLPPKLGPVNINVETVRSGKSVDFLRLEMTQMNILVLVATGVWASSNGSIEAPQLPMLEVPPPESCPAGVRLTETPTRLHEQWEIRSVDRSHHLKNSSKDSDLGLNLTWWIRPATETPISSSLIVAIADALPPPIFVTSQKLRLVPTIDLTVHIRANLSSSTWGNRSWVLANFSTTHASEGFIEEDGLIWHQDGTLLAMSRQLALVR
ncbi:MAG: thioesterase family protein [Acidimicrobiales bacterium]|jgi:acyl-CoA thioesterase|nr:thioesterase family protein [Acidimicrobiales bacterium]MDP6297889.1 thioesterase family protein [Acidimicrobiales bacterium]HJM28515.1 thioesterase family protein [Acidimicrobiales bacterium]HJM98314.1 thioesterase family protein [Acidimicrobiales bacterium]